MYVERFFVKQSGASGAVVGGVRILKEFSDSLIVVSVTGGSVEVVGDKLEIVRFDENEIEVSGKITAINTNASRGSRV